jgi:hypothetical protein
MPLDAAKTDWQSTIGIALVPVLLALVFCRASNAPIHHLDTWDHWKYGEWIVEHRRLPEHEPFAPAFSDQGRRMVDTMWLSQVAGYLVYSRAGMEGIALFYGLVELLKAGLYLTAFRRQGKSLRLGLLGVVLVQAGMWSYFGVFRPQMLGEVCWAALLAASACGLGDEARRWPLIALPLIVLLWANLHGSFVLGLLVLCVLLGGRLLEQRFATGRMEAALRDPRVRRLTIVLALSVAAACVNPYGPRLLSEVVHFRKNANLQQVGEWRPMIPLATYGAKAFALSVLVVLATLRYSPRRFSVADVVLLVLFGLAAWFAARMLPWWMTLCVYVLLPHWAAILSARKVSEMGTRRAPTPRARMLIGLAGLVCTVAVLLASGTGRWLLRGSPRPGQQQVSALTPVELVEHLKACIGTRDARVFAPIPWSDYLLWELPPTAQLFLYTHWEIFPPERLQHANRILTMRPAPNDWRTLLDRYKFDVLALSANEPGKDLFDHFLREGEPGWRIYYAGGDDPTELIAVRDGSGTGMRK